MDLSKFHVISIISNPVRYKTRYDLYRKFEKHMRDSGVQLTTVEMAFGDRPHEITEKGNPRHLQLRSFDELWHKENMINLGVQTLPSDWEYMAWVDADISFHRPDWAIETVHQLQHYMFVQMFSHAVDLGPNFEPIQHHEGFGYSFHQNRMANPEGAGYGGYYSTKKNFWHPGYAWACRREAFDAVGGLIDWAILGAGDHHMALAMIGQGFRSLPGGIHKRYLDELMEWQRRCDQYIKKDIGFVPGTISHYWHGKKRNRFYVERWKILIDNKYDPDTDLKRDWQGLLQLNVESERQRRLRDDIRFYFRSRHEDSIDLE